MEEIRDEFYVKVIQKRIDPNGDMTEIKKFWEKYWNEGYNGKLKDLNSNYMPLAIYSKYEGDQTKPFFLSIGQKTIDKNLCENEKKEGIEIIKVPKQKYFIIEKSGKMPDVVIEAWQEVWRSNLNRSYIVDVEEYPDMNTLKLYIGIK